MTGLVAAALERITGVAIFSSLVSGAVFIPNLAVSVRRLRDSGRSWLWLLTPIPGLTLFVVGLVMAAFNLYDFGYITTSQQLNDPNFPSSALIEQVIADSRFYQGFIMIVAGLILSFVFTVLTNIIFMALPSKSAAEGNKIVPPSF